MELLKQRIRQDGTVKGDDVLKVDSFLNHQMDVALFEEIGKEFLRRFDGCGVNKILTIEASGIGIACVTAQFFHCPVIFAKKSQTRNIDGGVYVTRVESFTRSGGELLVCLSVQGPVKQVLYMRTCQAELGDYVSSLCVPARALYRYDNTDGVMVRDGDNTTFIPVNILLRDGDDVYITAIQQGLLYEGQTVLLF